MCCSPPRPEPMLPCQLSLLEPTPEPPARQPHALHARSPSGEPASREVWRLVRHWLATRPYWRARYGTARQVMADPFRAALLADCARRALQPRGARAAGPGR